MEEYHMAKKPMPPKGGSKGKPPNGGKGTKKGSC